MEKCEIALANKIKRNEEPNPIVNTYEGSSLPIPERETLPLFETIAFGVMDVRLPPPEVSGTLEGRGPVTGGKPLPTDDSTPPTEVRGKLDRRGCCFFDPEKSTAWSYDRGIWRIVGELVLLDDVCTIGEI